MEEKNHTCFFSIYFKVPWGFFGPLEINQTLQWTDKVEKYWKIDTN